MSTNRIFDFAASILMFSLALVGLTVNIWFFVTTLTKKRYDSSYFRTRAVANVVMAFVFIIWAVPCTFLGYIFLSETVNGVAGQLAGWGAYIIGPFIQFCISVNRLFASYFPARFRVWQDKKLTYGVIGLSVIIGAVYFSYGIRGGCTFHFNITMLSWLPEDDLCAWDRAYFIFYSVATLFVGSSILNCASFVNFMKYTKRHTTNQAQRSHDRKNWTLLIQNIVQDSFFLIDLLAVTFAVKWYDGIWYQFLLNSALWLIHITADGMVMMASSRLLLKLSPRNRVSTDTRSSRPVRDMQSVR